MVEALLSKGIQPIPVNDCWSVYGGNRFLASVSTPLKEQETQLSERKPDTFRAADEECGFCENIIDFLMEAAVLQPKCNYGKFGQLHTRQKPLDIIERFEL